jgi:hypothetical protein
MAKRQVTIFINGQEVANNLKAIAAEKRKVTNELNRMVIGSDEYNAKVKELRKLDGVIKEHRNNVAGTSGAWDKLKKSGGAFVAFAGAAFAADKIIGYGKELFKLGTEMEVLGRKAETVFGEALPLVTEQAEKNAAAMGLSTGAFIDAAAAIGDLLIPMGFQREEAAAISTELVNLSGALAEWSGGQLDAEGVTQVLSKAVLGQREGLKQLGISITEAEIQTRLAEKGLKGLTGEMLQQAKAAATLELITEKSADAQEAFANNADTNIRRQAELAAAFREIKEAIATALIPVFGRLLEAAKPVVTGFATFVKTLLSGEAAGGKLSAVMKVVGVVLGNVWAIVKPLGAAFFGLVRILADRLAPVADFIGTKLLQLYNVTIDVVNGISRLLKSDFRLQKIDIEGFKASLKGAKDSLDDSGIGATDGKPTKGFQLTPTDGDLEEQKKRADKLADERKKQLENLQKILSNFQEEARISELSEDQQALERIRLRYQKEIDLALELERQGNTQLTALRIELQQLQAQAIRAEEERQREAQVLAREEAWKKEQEQIESFNQQRAEAQRQLFDAARQVILDEYDNALIDLERNYEAQQELARRFGLDTLEIDIAYEREKERIKREFRERTLNETFEAQRQEAAALAAAYNAFGEIVSGAIALVGDEMSEFSGLSRLLTLAQIGLKTAEGLAAATAAGAGLVFPANLGAIASGVATVLANMAAARRALDSAPRVPQRRWGGYIDVTGEDDNRSYRAQYIGRPGSGMLPSHPVLLDTVGGRVLASEAGREYFVSNAALRNPAVFDHVRAIDNIVRARQFRDGGFTDAPSTTANASSDTTAALLPILAQLITILTQLRDKEFRAIIEDRTIQDFRERETLINRYSGRS